MNSIKAIVFDMDGVLIEAKDWHYEALNRSLGLFGYTISRYDHLVTYDGLPTREKLSMLTREQNLPQGLHPLINDLKQEYTLEMVHSRCRPHFGHEYALSRLKSEGYLLGVASNAVRTSVEAMLKKAHILPCFDVVLSNQDVLNAKPDPAIYLEAMKRLGVQPHETLVVEDNPKGIQAARAAHAHVMEIREVSDVTYENILQHIGIAEALECST